MKKWVLATAAIAIAFLLLIYSFIPARIKIVSVTNQKASANAIISAFAKQSVWDQLTLGKGRLAQPLSNGADIVLSYKGLQLPVRLLVLFIRDDSTEIRWESSFPPSAHAANRFSNYLAALDFKRELQAIVQRTSRFCQADSNLYGYQMTNESTVDTSLLATRFTSAEYPPTGTIYRQIGKLKTYAEQNGLLQTDHPMLNITLNDDSSYRCMAAIPINKNVIGLKGDIFFTRMEPGRFITAEIRGGTGSVQHGHEMVQRYINDYKKLLMAMPFEHLITDRQIEKDTSKWITRLYYPVP